MVKVPRFLRPRLEIDPAELELVQARTVARLASIFGVPLESLDGAAEPEAPPEAEQPQEPQQAPHAELAPHAQQPRAAEQPREAGQAAHAEHPLVAERALDDGPAVRPVGRGPAPAPRIELPSKLVGVMQKPDEPRGDDRPGPRRDEEPRVTPGSGPVTRGRPSDDWRSRADAYILAKAFGTAPAPTPVRPAEPPVREEPRGARVAQPVEPAPLHDPVDLHPARSVRAEPAPLHDPVAGANAPTRVQAGSRRTELPAHHEDARRGTRPERVPVGRGAPAPATLSVSCPYCGRLLETPPAASRACPRCHQRIVVKHADGRAVYLATDAVPIFESERRRAASYGRWTRERQRWLKLAAAAGAARERAEWLAAAPPSDEVVESARALYMTTLERLFRSAKADRRWEEASRLRREQTMTLFRLAGSPSPPPEALVELKRDAEVAALRGIAQIAREAQLVSADCCDICRADDGRISRIAQEVRAPRLPHQGCPTGLCRCRWALPPRA
jgi:ketosteroid isomerase-like protein